MTFEDDVDALLHDVPQTTKRRRRVRRRRPVECTITCQRCGCFAFEYVDIALDSDSWTCLSQWTCRRCANEINPE